MNCEQIRKRLDDYFDGSLSQKEENALEEHLLSCDDCRRAFEDVENMLYMIRNTEEPERMPDDDFFEKVFRRAVEQAAPELSSVPEARPPSIIERLKNLFPGHQLGVRIAEAAAFALC